MMVRAEGLMLDCLPQLIDPAIGSPKSRCALLISP